MPIRFLLAGAVNTVIGLSLILGSGWLLRLDPFAANLLGYSIAIPIGFVLHSRWTFQHEGRIFPAVLRYGAVLASAFLANLGALMAALHLLAFPEPAAQLVGVAVYGGLSYAGCRWLAFDRRSQNGRRVGE